MPIWQVPGPSEMKIIILSFPSYYFALINKWRHYGGGRDGECVPTFKPYSIITRKWNSLNCLFHFLFPGAVVECSIANSQRQFQLDPSIYFSRSRPASSRDTAIKTILLPVCTCTRNITIFLVHVLFFHFSKHLLCCSLLNYFLFFVSFITNSAKVANSNMDGYFRVGWPTDCWTKTSSNQIVECFSFILLAIFLHFTTLFCVLHSVSPGVRSSLFLVTSITWWDSSTHCFAL